MSRNPRALPQLVYHGSPHRGIERFSTEKVGTGEGAQSYGWGLYFAELREVAQWYKETLSRSFGYKNTQVKAWLVEATNFADGAWRGLHDIVQTSGGDPVIAAQWLEKYALRSSSPCMKDAYILMARMVLDGDIVLQNDGQLYEVEIPGDSEMLLWDKPLSEQPEAVKRALKGYHPPSVADLVSFGFSEIEAKLEYQKKLRLFEEQTGESFYGQALKPSEAKDRSRALANLGIKGIKYLDSFSRGVGKGTFNYVIFDGADTMIKDVFYSHAAGRKQPPLERPASIEAQGLDQFETDAFKAWFGDSMALDSGGRPLVLHHGSSTHFEVFDMSKGLDGAHWFTPNLRHAASFGEWVHSVCVSIVNPLVIAQEDLNGAWDKEHPSGNQDDRNLLPRDFVKNFVAMAKERGHDGLIIKDMGDRDIESDMYLPFTPEQIKSVMDGNGQLNCESPSIRVHRERVR